MWEEILALVSPYIVEIVVLLAVYFFGGIKDAVVAFAENRKAEVGVKQFEQEKGIVETFVRAAEQIVTLNGGQEKFKYAYEGAIKELNKQGLDVSKEQVEALVEESVLKVNAEKPKAVEAVDPIQVSEPVQVEKEVK